MPLLRSISNVFGRVIGSEARSSSLNNPSVPLSAAGFLSWVMGGEPTASGEQVTISTALQQITVYACVSYLANAVASLPLRIFETMPDGGRKAATDHALAYLLRWEPNEEMSAFTFWSAIVGSMALDGNGYAEIQRDKGGNVVGFWPLHPQLTEPKRLMNGDLVYETKDGMQSGKSRTLVAANVLHVPLFCFDGLKGYSPVHLARQGIGLARAAEKYGARFFGNGGRPSGVLSSKASLTPEQVTQMKETWNLTQGGDASRSTAVLPGEWTYEQIGLSPEESQFLLTRGFQRADIASIWGVPPHKVGDTSRLSNSNHEDMELAIVTDTLRPYITRIEQELVRKLIPRAGRNANKHEIEFDVSNRLRGNFQSTMQGLAIGKQWGFVTTNKALKAIGENPIGKEGDVFWAPVNMQNAALLLKTEPTLDQPLPGAGGTPPSPEPPPVPEPTPAERNMLGQYDARYMVLFADAFARCLKRDKRDLPAISAIFGPVLNSISRAAVDIYPVPEEVRSSIVSDVMVSMERRAAKWGGDSTDQSGIEFIRAIRSIHINISRESAGSAASKEVENV